MEREPRTRLQSLDREALIQKANVSPRTALSVLHDQIFTEDTRQYLESRFLAEQDAVTASVLSEAEQTVRASL